MRYSPHTPVTRSTSIRLSAGNFGTPHPIKKVNGVLNLISAVRSGLEQLDVLLVDFISLIILSDLLGVPAEAEFHAVRDDLKDQLGQPR